MRSRLFLKLFLAMLACCLAVVVAMALALSWSFERGFVHYMQEREQQRIQALSAMLLEEYAEHGNWRFVTEHKNRWWWRALRLSAGERPHEYNDSSLRHSPMGRTILLSAKGKVLAGSSSPNSALQRYPIYYQDQLIAYVAAPPARTDLPHALAEQRFQRQQLKTLWWVLGLATTLAALVSYILARRFLQPIQQLKIATTQVAQGDYGIRLPIRNHDELSQLAAAFNEMTAKLATTERLRTELLANVSHELRTPLSVLQANIEAIEDGIRPASPANLQALSAEISQLNKLINDLYQLSLTDTQAWQLHPQADVAVDSLIRSACQTFTPRAEAAGVQLHCTCPALPRIQADPTRLLQVLHNLLENSVRYTDRGGQIHVHAAVLDQRLRITIEDSAPGVTAEDLPRLFERLFRVDSSRSRSFGGAGLGLPICQQIIHAHGGQLHAQASTLGGLAIVVTLPIIINTYDSSFRALQSK